MNLNEKQIVLDSIKHHERMQKWVKKQDKNSRPDCLKMVNEINENWFGNHCALCEVFFEEELSCSNCLLFKKYGKCFDSASKNAWWNIDNSETWKEWLKWGKKLVKQLKSLLI